MEKSNVQNAFSQKIHVALRYILKVTLQKSEITSEASGVMHLGNLEEEFRQKQQGPPKITLEDIEILLVERIKLMKKNAFLEGLPYFLECYRRCLRSDAIGGAFPKVIVEAIPKIQQELINYASLLIACPEIYELEANVTEKSKMLYSFLQRGVGNAFFDKFVDCIYENESDASMELFMAVVGLINEESSREIFRTYTGLPLKMLSLLTHNKRTVKALVFHPSFLLLASLPSAWGFSHFRVGMQLQLHSLMGRIFALTPVDAGNTWPEKERFSTVFYSSPTITRDYIVSNFQTYRASLNRIMEGTTEIFKHVCTVEEQRERIVLLFAMFLNSNQRRKMLGHRAFLRATPETFDATYPFILRSDQENTFGVYLNVFWTLLLLTEPMKLEKIDRINYFFPQKMDATSIFLLGNTKKYANLGDEEALANALQFLKKNEETNKSPNFPTLIFWLTLRSLAIFFNPAMAEFVKILKQLEQVGSGEAHARDPLSIRVRGDIFAWELVLLNPRFTNALIHFLHLLFTFLLRATYCYTSQGDFSETSDIRADVLRKKIFVLVYNKCNNSKPFTSENSSLVSPQFTVFPAAFVDDLLEALQNVIILHRLSKSLNTHEVDPVLSLDCELLTCLCFTLMMNPEKFRNVNSRCDGARLLAALYTEGILSKLFDAVLPLRRVFISACTFSFIDSQKATYYYRLQFRLPIVEVFVKVLVEEEFRKHFHVLIKEQPDMFVHLIHLLLNDVSELVERAMNSLSEIRKRELSSATPTTERGSEDVVEVPPPEEDTQHEEGDEQLEESPFSTLQQKTRQVVSLGYQTCLLLWTFSKYFGETIVENAVLIPHMITCLDCCLDHLVGPKCLQLKVRNFEEYNFNPKSWLTKLCETYVYLVMADKEAQGATIFREILQDGRFFQLSTFKRAHHVLRREGLISGTRLNQFNSLVSSLFTLQNEEDQLEEADIPDTFLDPIMQEIMLDPVKLPSSHVVMDRKNIERHLMSDASDPFNRLPLKKEDLIPATDLREEIMAYIHSKRNVSTHPTL